MSELIPQPHGGALLPPPKHGDPGRNPAGRKTLQAYVKECENSFALQLAAGKMTWEDIRRLAKKGKGNDRIAAVHMLQLIERPDVADFEPLLDGQKNLRELRADGVDTAQLKKVKSKERSFKRGEQDVKEVEREIELHDHAGDAYNRLLPAPKGDGVMIGINGGNVLIVTPWTRAQLQEEYSAKAAQVHAITGGDEPATPAPEPIVMGESFAALGTLPDQFILIESRRGTGKTRGILTYFMQLALAHAGSRWLILRSTRTRLTDSAVATFIDEVLPLFGLPVPKCERKQLTTYTLPNTAEFIFQGLDDPGRQQSVAISGAYVVEGCEIDQVEIISALSGAMRKQSEPPVRVRQCIICCNPDAPSHELNQIAEPLDDSYRMVETREQYERVLRHNRTLAPPGKWKRIVSHFMDNPRFFDVVKWDWTADGAEYLKTLDWLSGNLKKRWLYGLWTAAQGSVFGDVFDEEFHVVDNFEPPMDWPLYIGWDPGIDHVTGMPWVVVSPTNDLFLWDEVYEGGKIDDPSRPDWSGSIADHVQHNVKPRLGGRAVTRWFGDPNHFFSSTAQSPESCAAQAVKCGLSWAVPWARLQGPAKIAGVNALIQMLQNTLVYARTGVRRGQCLYVMRKCKHCRAELQSWSYKRNAKGERPDGDEAYEDRNNHLIGDPLVGMVATGELKWRDRNSGGAQVSDNG